MIELFFYLLQKLTDALVDHGISLIPDRKTKVCKHMVASHKRLGDLIEAVKHLQLALSAKYALLTGDSPTIPQEELNIYKQKTHYYFEGSDAVAGMNIEFAGWTWSRGDTGATPKFNSVDPKTSKDAEYNDFVTAFIQHTSQDVYAKLQRLANTLEELLRAMQEGTLKILDDSLYQLFFRLNVMDTYFCYWVFQSPPVFNMSQDNLTLAIWDRHAKSGHGLEQIRKLRMFEDIAEVQAEFADFRIFELDDPKDIEAANKFLDDLSRLLQTAEAKVSEFLKKNYSLEEILSAQNAG